MRTVSKPNDHSSWHLIIKLGRLVPRRPYIVLNSFSIHINPLLIITLHNLIGNFLTDLVDIFLKASNTWLTTIVFNQMGFDVIGYAEVVGGWVQACLLDSFRQQEVVQDVLLLGVGVTSDFDYFHPVEDCWVKGVKSVRCAEEQDLGEIDWNVQEVICEFVVLLRIKNFKENTTWITLLTPLAKLVNLINQDNWVLNLDHLQSSHNLPWYSPNIRSPKTLERTRISVASHRDPMELPTQRLGNALTNGCLPHTWWSNKAKDLSLNTLIKFANGDELQDPLLDVIHAIVTLVQDVFCHANVKVLLRVDAIRHLGQILKVSLGNLKLTVCLFHLHKSLDLFIDHLHHVLRDGLIFEIIQELLDLLLFLIRLISKVLLQALVYLFQLLLCFGLILGKVILLFKFVP